MKRTWLILLLSIVYLMAHPNITPPDFAYPKTTAAQALKDLETANAKADAHAALNALIRYIVSQSLIDGTSMQDNVKLTLSTAEKYKADDLYPLYIALAAKEYQAIYADQRWTYDQREMPLFPLPEDITEWSGAQFKEKIRQLCSECAAQTYAGPLKKLNIKGYSDIITADGLTATFYPTLLDFIYSTAYNILGDIDATAQANDICVKAIDESIIDSAPHMLWLDIQAKRSNTDNAVKDCYLRHSDNPYAGIFLTDIQYNDDAQKAWLLAESEKYNKAFPDNPFKKQIANTIKIICNPSVSVNFPSVIAQGASQNLIVENTNATKYAINIYLINDDLSYVRDNRQILNIINQGKPVQSIERTCKQPLPFNAKDTVEIRLNKPGTYVIVPLVPGKNADSKYYSTTRCLPIFPIMLRGENRTEFIVVDPSTGKADKDIQIQVKGSAHLNKTDRRGITGIDTRSIDARGGIAILKDGVKYRFDDIQPYYSGGYDQTSENYNINILTDRALYHPGDEVNVLAVVSKSQTDAQGTYTSHLVSGKTVSLRLRDANYQIIDTISGKCDSFGRFTASFTLPNDGLTGTFNIEAGIGPRNTNGNKDIMVSDYRMPDFELKIEAVECNVPTKGCVTVSGNATSYSGMPMSDTKITTTVKQSSWWWWRGTDNTKLYSTEITTDTQGKYSVVLPDSIFTDQRGIFQVVLDAVSPSGSTASASRTFSLTEQYNITVNIPNQNIDSERPFSPDVKVYDAKGDIIDLPLEWSLSKDDKQIACGPFTGTIDLSSVNPGSYTLSISAKDKDLANTELTNIIIYNRKSGIVPDYMALWTPTNTYNITDASGGNAEIQFATGSKQTDLYYYIEDKANIKAIDMKTYGYGYHTLAVEMPDNCEKATLTLMCIKDCQVISQAITLNRKKPTGLTIEGESFRDNLIPDAKETWTIKVRQADGSSTNTALVLDMYNKALDALRAQSFTLNFPTERWYRSISRQFCSNYLQSNNFRAQMKLFNVESLNAPEFNTYGYPLTQTTYYGFRAEPMLMASARPSRKMSLANTLDMADGAVMEECAEDEAAYVAVLNSTVTGAEAEEDATQQTGAEEAFDYRDSDVPLAIWAPVLTTDAEGEVTYSFSVPNANTTWRLRAVAWSQNMEVGSLMRDFVASKPVMVQPNTPRFLRSGDNATVLATVMNNTDSAAVINTTVEIFNPLNGAIIETRKYTNEIGAKLSATVSINITAGIDTNAIGYRVRATNGKFSDGEQSVIRILPSVAQLIETEPFYLNPGETEFTTKLPDEKVARLSLTFCENPAWTIVTALPGLRTSISDYANSAAAALFSAAIAQGIVKDNPAIAKALKQWSENPTDSALVSMLQKNEDLKIALLNSTPWVQAAQSDTERMANLTMLFDRKEVDASISQAIKILKDLQRADGGWAWGKWCDESSVWVTSNVLGMIGALKQCGWMPKSTTLDSMISKALRYYDSNVEDTDMIYCLIRPYFSETTVNANGKKVIAATIKEIKADWKKYTDPAYKSMAAEALYLNGEKALAKTLMKSVSEFGVYTKDQGLRFPSVEALYDYAIILEAYGMIEPQSKEVDGLRQQLIVRKQATDWGSAVVTTEVVKSILTTGSTWTVDAKGATIQAGDNIIVPKNAIETSTGSLTADLSSFAGETLKVTTTGTGPAYGAVYEQFSRQMDQVKAASCPDLDIEKHMFVRRGTSWETADSLNVGDRVKIQLTIHSKRNLQYVSIIDERPAAFQPVDQLPGWLWSEGVGFYRENRDASTNLNVVFMRPGTYQLTYEMNVGVAGRFSSGVATIQSQYAPELTAHSSGAIINVK